MNLLEKLTGISSELATLNTEIILLGGACVILIIGLLNVPSWFVRAVFVTSLVLAFNFMTPGPDLIFANFLVNNPLTFPVTKILLMGTALIVVFPRIEFTSSFYFLILIVLVGALFLLKVRHLLMIYLAFELVSYGCYLLSNYTFSKRSHEAAIKYLLYGGVSSAIMLFGISLIYGSTGSLILNVPGPSSLQTIGIVMLLAGLFFKISMVPFHSWVPNVYQELPADALAFLSTIPKLAGLVLLSNVVEWFNWGDGLVLACGVITIGLGTIGAINQSNLRRMMAYGSIAFTGYLIPLLVIDSDPRYFLFFALIYSLMNVGLFFGLSILEKEGIREINQVNGQAKGNLFVMIPFLIILISFIGLPPTAGFLAKWFVFINLWVEYQGSQQVLIIVYLIVAILATVVSLYFYLLIPFRALFYPSDFVAIMSDKAGITILFCFSIFLFLSFFYPELISMILG